MYLLEWDFRVVVNIGWHLAGNTDMFKMFMSWVHRSSFPHTHSGLHFPASILVLTCTQSAITHTCHWLSPQDTHISTHLTYPQGRVWSHHSLCVWTYLTVYLPRSLLYFSELQALSLKSPKDKETFIESGDSVTFSATVCLRDSFLVYTI